ncbi:MAG: hypothetical protein ACTTKK_05730, partial [Ottowia sp.]
MVHGISPARLENLLMQTGRASFVSRLFRAACLGISFSPFFPGWAALRFLFAHTKRLQAPPV